MKSMYYMRVIIFKHLMGDSKILVSAYQSIKLNIVHLVMSSTPEGHFYYPVQWSLRYSVRPEHCDINYSCREPNRGQLQTTNKYVPDG